MRSFWLELIICKVYFFFRRMLLASYVTLGSALPKTIGKFVIAFQKLVFLLLSHLSGLLVWPPQNHMKFDLFTKKFKQYCGFTLNLYGS